MNSETPPLISVVVPIYNGMPFIIETIESVCRQTCPDWELILCDNCSKDTTVATVKAWLSEHSDSRISLREEQNHLPMGESWNRSMTYARGEYIKLLPSDDILLSGCLEVQSKILQEKADMGFVTSSKEVIDARGTKYMERRPLREGRYTWQDSRDRIVFAIANLIGEPGGVMFRRSLLDTCGAFDNKYRYFIDLELYLRLLQKSDLYVVGEPLYQFRTHGNSASASSRRVAVEEYKVLLDQYGEALGLPGRPLLRKWLGLKAWIISWARSLIMRSRSQNA